MLGELEDLPQVVGGVQQTVIDVGAVTLAARDEQLGFQRGQRAADGGPADAQLACQVVLGG